MKRLLGQSRRGTGQRPAHAGVLESGPELRRYRVTGAVRGSNGRWADRRCGGEGSEVPIRGTMGRHVRPFRAVLGRKAATWSRRGPASVSSHFP